MTTAHDNPQGACRRAAATASRPRTLRLSSMPDGRSWWSAVVICAVSLVMAGAAAGADGADDCSLRVAWEPYGAYTFRNDEGEVTGIDIEVVKAVAQEIGCDVSFRELPWARILLEVEQGAVDLSTSTSWTEERTAWAFFSRPYRQTEMALYVRRGEAQAHGLEALTDIADGSFRLGVIDGYFLGEAYSAALNDADFVANVEVAADYATNLRKLVHGRIDGFLVDDVTVLEDEARALGILDRVERHSLAIAGDDLHFMFSKRSVPAQTVTDFDRALAKLLASGRIDAIVRQFLDRNAAAGGPS